MWVYVYVCIPFVDHYVCCRKKWANASDKHRQVQINNFTRHNRTPLNTSERDQERDGSEKKKTVNPFSMNAWHTTYIFDLSEKLCKSLLEKRAPYVDIPIFTIWRIKKTYIYTYRCRLVMLSCSLLFFLPPDVLFPRMCWCARNAHFNHIFASSNHHSIYIYIFRCVF